MLRSPSESAPHSRSLRCTRPGSPSRTPTSPTTSGGPRRSRWPWISSASAGRLQPRAAGPLVVTGRRLGEVEAQCEQPYAGQRLPVQLGNSSKAEAGVEALRRLGEVTYADHDGTRPVRPGSVDTRLDECLADAPPLGRRVHGQHPELGLSGPRQLGVVRPGEHEQHRAEHLARRVGRDQKLAGFGPRRHIGEHLAVVAPTGGELPVGPIRRDRESADRGVVVLGCPPDVDSAQFAHSTTAMRSPSCTTSPSFTAICTTVPPDSATTGISIFIDSRMTRVSPSSTVSPAALTTFQTFATISARISSAIVVLSGTV